MKKFYLFLIALLWTAPQLFAWGQKGHDIVAHIAERHLTKRAASRIEKALDNHSPVYYANWMDNASNTPEYAYSKTWHYLNVDEGYTLETMPKNENGDVLKAVTELYAALKKGGLSPEEECIKLRMLIHLVGDMHCPMHAGRLSDLGGNRRPVVYFNSTTNLHSIWDTSLVESAHKWSYTEWANQLDRLSKEEIAAVQAGEPADWMAETVAICAGVYEHTPEGAKLSYDYLNWAAPLIEQQVVRGGLRLARLLNELYK